MITKVTINNFKKLEKITFPLSQSVVIIGPNNSGKSTIFQALCLWEIGVTNYIVAHKKGTLNKNKAVTLNRKDLLNSPISDAKSLWLNKKTADPKTRTPHILLEIEIEGTNNQIDWVCKTEFYYYNKESFSCKVVSGFKEMSKLYNNDEGIRFGFLQPMSGISTDEDKLTQGSIDRKLGEGKTSEVLRNICFEILYPETIKSKKYDPEKNWKHLCKAMKSMFGANLQKPVLLKSTGIIELEYIENGIRYDISAGGTGFRQMLLLLAYMLAHHNTILLLDEPDAHLEVIRQREAFQVINNIANETNSQLIIASHSEVILEEAAEASKVIALIENQVFELNEFSSPQIKHSIQKALTEIGWEEYYLARSKKHILYLEGATDLQMLLCFANKLNHKVEPLLRVANVQYTADNVPNTAVKNFKAIKEFFPELKGLALFDKIDKNIEDIKILNVKCWQKRELENYFAKPDILYRHAKLLGNKYSTLGSAKLLDIMKQTVQELTAPLHLKDLKNEWWDKTKISDEWLDIIFPEFYKSIEKSQEFYKRDYYQLIMLLKPDEIDKEISEKLDMIYEVLH